MSRKVYFIRVLTPLHVGSGTGLGYVDLPIYREAHTDFPAIPSSAIKGAFRSRRIKDLAKRIKDKGTEEELVKLLSVKDKENFLNKPSKLVEELIERFEEINEKKPSESVKNILEEVKELADIFGSRDKGGKGVFSDARVLLFPVKSLKGIFALITCPYVLRRFNEDAGIEVQLADTDLGQDECIVLNESKVVVDMNRSRFVVLEEFLLKVRGIESKRIPVPFRENMDRVVIVHDDIFTYLVKNSTEVQTHIKVDVETGTVERGALWMEEYVPSETVFYTCVEGYPINDGTKIQLGGNSGTGKGVVEVRNHEEC